MRSKRVSRKRRFNTNTKTKTKNKRIRKYSKRGGKRRSSGAGWKRLPKRSSKVHPTKPPLVTAHNLLTERRLHPAATRGETNADAFRRLQEWKAEIGLRPLPSTGITYKPWNAPVTNPKNKPVSKETLFAAINKYKQTQNT